MSKVYSQQYKVYYVNNGVFLRFVSIGGEPSMAVNIGNSNRQLSYRLLDLTLLLMLFPFQPPPSGTISPRMFDHALTRPLSNRD